MENKQNNYYFDKKSEFEKEIKKHLIEIQKICVKNDIPFLYAFAVKNTDKQTEYATNCMTSASMDIKLTDDRLSKCLCAMNGWDFKIPGVEADNEYFTNIAVEDFDDKIEEIPEELL